MTTSRICLDVAGQISWHRGTGAGTQFGVVFAELAEGETEGVQRFLAAANRKRGRPMSPSSPDNGDPRAPGGEAAAAATAVRRRRNSTTGCGASTPSRRATFPRRRHHLRHHRRRSPVVAKVAVFVALAALAVLLLRAFVIQPFAVPGDAMSPTLQAGDRILVIKSGLFEGPSTAARSSSSAAAVPALYRGRRQRR